MSNNIYLGKNGAAVLSWLDAAAHKAAIHLTQFDRLFYLRLIRLCIENGERDDCTNRYYIDASIKDIALNLDSSQRAVTYALKRLVVCGAINRIPTSNQFPRKVYRTIITLFEREYENIERNETMIRNGKVEYTVFDVEEMDCINNMVAKEKLSSFTRGRVVELLNYNLNINDDEMICNLIEGLKAKLENITDDEWNEIVLKLPFPIAYSAETNVDVVPTDEEEL